MVKVVLHLNASAPLRPNSSSASPDLRGPSWSRDGVAMAACDEPAASDVPPPAGVAPPAGVPPPAADCVG
jgi:hypothetical protein